MLAFSLQLSLFIFHVLSISIISSSLTFFLTADNFLPVSGEKSGEGAWFGYKQLQITSSQFNGHKGKRAFLSWHLGLNSKDEAQGLDQCSGVGLMLGPFTVAKVKSNYHLSAGA